MPGFMPGIVHQATKPALAEETANYELIRDDVISVEPVPVELKWAMTEEEFAEYAEVAGVFLAANQEFREESLRRFLNRNDILTYSTDKVIKLLKYKNKGDIPSFHAMNDEEKYKLLGNYYGSTDRGIHIRASTFNKFVPARVVERIGYVLRNFPQLYCYISDTGKTVCENFVAVIFGKDSEIFIIDSWGKNESVVAGKEA